MSAGATDMYSESRGRCLCASTVFVQRREDEVTANCSSGPESKVVQLAIVPPESDGGRGCCRYVNKDARPHDFVTGEWPWGLTMRVCRADDRSSCARLVWPGWRILRARGCFRPVRAIATRFTWCVTKVSPSNLFCLLALPSPHPAPPSISYRLPLPCSGLASHWSEIRYRQTPQPH